MYNKLILERYQAMSAAEEKAINIVYDVAVIGAGLAGSMSAHLLTEAGQSVCVIEKSRGCGGRCGNQRINDQVRVDMGSPYIHTKHPDTIKVLDQLISANIALRWPQQDKNTSQTYIGSPSLSAICRHLVQASRLLTNTRAHHLELDPIKQVWRIRDSHFQLITQCKKVILCIPAPQAAALLAATQGTEDLWVSANQASKRSTSQWALWLETAHSDLNSIIYPNHPVIECMIKDNQKHAHKGTSCDRWVIHSRSDWASLNLEKSKEHIADELIKGFFEATELELIRHGSPHRWLFSRFLPNPSSTAFKWNEELNIGLAGDWLSSGDTEGALLSAHKIVQKIRSTL